MLALKRSFLCPRLLVLSAGQLHVHSSASLKCSPFSFLLPDGHHLSPRFIGFPSRLPESTCQRIIFVKCQPDLVLSLSVAFSDPVAIGRKLPIAQDSGAPLARPAGRCGLTPVRPAFPAALTQLFLPDAHSAFTSQLGVTFPAKPALLTAFPGPRRLAFACAPTSPS